MREVKEPKKKISEKISTAIDRAVSVFAPAWAYKRSVYRKAIDTINRFSSYRGAEKNRLRASWLPGANSADEDLLPELADLRERSRDLNRNDATAAGITGTITTNVIGTGIKPQSRIDKDGIGIDDATAIIFQRAAEREWEKWVPYADAGNRLDFYEIQQLVDRQILENGEVLLLPVMLSDPDRPYAMAFDVVEGDRLATPSDKRGDKSIRYGVKIGDRGEPIGYYIKKTHPGDLTVKTTQWKSDDFIYYPVKNGVGRKNIIHLYWMNRPGQTRGMPFFAPVLTYFKDLADYMEAELVAARIAACFSIFVKKEDAYAAATARTSSTNSASQRIEELEPGMIEYLGPGEDITAFNPNRPGNSFDMFINRILRSISAALGLPYELVSKDFSQTNYSSARAALLEARKYFRMRQDWISKKLCQPAWEMLLEEAFLKDKLPISSDIFLSNRLDITRARWIAPGWQWVDPVKEAESSKTAIEIGVSTLADEAASQGKDWEEVLEQQARERAKRKELGIPEPAELKNPPAPAMPQEEKKPSEDDDMNGMQSEIIKTSEELGGMVDEQLRESLQEA